MKRLTNLEESRIKKGPVWSPNGKQIAFHADIDKGGQIFIMDQDGANLTQLTRLPGYNVEPTRSPDGNEIIFNSVPTEGKTKMLLMNSDGSNIRNVFNPDGENWYPRVTHRNQIVFTSDFDQKGNYNIYLMNPDGANKKQLTKETHSAYYPFYSKNGKRVVFMSYQDKKTLISIL